MNGCAYWEGECEDCPYVICYYVDPDDYVGDEEILGE